MSTHGLVVTGQFGVELKGRRRLGDDAVFMAMLDELQAAVQKRQETDANACIEDLDISQNHLSLEQFETLFQTLAICGVKVRRFRMFGCPTLNDEAMQLLAEFFRANLENDSVPTEMHLSDCAITSVGFTALLDAFEEKELYPLTDSRTGRSVPLYLRLENNYIEQAVIQEKVDAGVVRCFSKQGSVGQRTAADATHKIDLVAAPGRFQQKEGPPPAPEDAPAPKNIPDQFSNDSKGKGKGKGWAGADPWNSMAYMWPAAAQQAWAPQQAWAGAGAKGCWQQGAGAKGGKGVVTPPVGAKGFAKGATQQQPARVVRPGQQATATSAYSNLRGSVGQATATDRSRTPAPRGGAAAPARPPPAKAKASLPYPWEEHHSDEHGLPYYWNSETGDAVWEKAACK